MPDPENGNVQVFVRRRTRRHQRNRLIRRWFAGLVLAVFTAGVSTLAFMYLSPSLFRSGQSAPSPLQQPNLSRTRAATLDQILSHAITGRPVYRYSVVPGGVEDAKELKWVAEHDPIVAEHYAGFDYQRARVVRLTLARTAYMSYRIGNHIYWMHRRVTLHKGETLITDGRMTARSRCGNRVEEAPRQEASPMEPTPEEFEEPIRAGEGTAMQAPPIAFQSALLAKPTMPGLGPAGPLFLYDPVSQGLNVPFSPPPIPAGLCEPVKKKGSIEISSEGDTIGKKKEGGRCGSVESTGTVPEPGTWLLLATGLAFIYWQGRRKLSHN